jgi:ABC-type lipoprotein release transport system permease subunit
MDFDQYDDRLALTTLASGQDVMGRGDEVMGVEAIVKDVEHADAVGKAIEEALGGPPYQVMDWYELNKQLFTAMYGDKKP